MRFGPFAFLLLAACTTAPPPEAPRPAPKAVKRVFMPRPVPAFHWEPLEVSVDPSIEPVKTPLADEAVDATAAATAELAKWPELQKDALYTRGFVVVEAPERRSMGRTYEAIGKRGLRPLVTLDALAEVTHLAVSAAFAEVEARELVPRVGEVLTRLAGRLDPLMAKATTDRARALRMARGVVWVARALSDDVSPPADLASDVLDEVRRIRGRVDPRPSPLLGGATVDYRAPAAAATNASRVADTLLWLERAPLALVGADRLARASVSTQGARDATRAAVLLGLALDARIDRDAAAAAARAEALLRFLCGPSDDWTPSDLLELAVKEGVHDLADVDDVARIDRIRTAALSAARPRVLDGTIAPALLGEGEGDGTAARRVAPVVRLLGGRTGLDAMAQQLLVAPFVGTYRGTRSVPTLEGGRRVLSRSLDLAAALGNDAARTALKLDGDDDYEGFDRAIKRLAERRPRVEDATLHASVYLSLLDLFGAMLTRSAADASLASAGEPLWSMRNLELALATHASVRHVFELRGRPSPRPLALPPAATRRPVLVEPHPEVIGRMVALVRQLQRGLAAYRVLAPDSAAGRVVVSAERVLTLAFQASVLMASDLPQADDDAQALAAFGEWLVAFEEAVQLAAERGVVTHVDLATGRAMTSGTGRTAELWLVVRDPTTKRPTLGVGGAVSFRESTAPGGGKAFEEDVRAGRVAAAPWVRPYRFVIP